MSTAMHLLKAFLTCGSAVQSPNPLSVAGCGVNLADGTHDLLDSGHQETVSRRSVDCTRAQFDSRYRRRLRAAGVDVDSICAEPIGSTGFESRPKLFEPSLSERGPSRTYDDMSTIDTDTPDVHIDAIDEPEDDFTITVQERSCPHCGAEIEREDAVYCPKCGEQLDP